MVGPLLILKLLHFKMHKQRLVNTESDSHSSSETAIKKEVDVQFICRVCLREGDNPIYGNDVIEDVSEALRTIADIDISLLDNYPKFLCQACYAHLQGAILLRKTAKQSNIILKNPVNLSDNANNTETSDFIEEQTIDYHCKKCSLSFQSFDEYSEHRLSEGHENMRLTCHICNKSYAQLYFKRHLSLHKQEASYMCDVCGKKFIIQGHLMRHRVTHFLDLPFKCSLCPYKGRFKESLKMHMRNHTGEKPYHCSQCPRQFVNKSNLNKHMLTHRGDHDFKCEACGRGFYTKRNLELHFKVDHTGIKEHKCDQCGKAFGYRKQMMKHQLKVHKRQKLKSGRMPLYLQLQSKQQHAKE